MPKSTQKVNDIQRPVIEYPKFEVITPQTKRSVLVQTMTVAQEKMLKGSQISIYTLPNIINKLVFSLIVDKKKPYDTFEGFLKSFTPNDRTALMYGIYQASYETIDDFTVTCSNPMCPKPNYEVSVPIQQITQIEFYNGEEDILSKRVTLTLPVSKAKVVVKQYTLWDEHQYIEMLKMNRIKNPGTLDQYLFIESIDLPTTKGVLTYDTILDIDYAMDKLPSKDRKLVFKTIYEEFTKYNVTMELESTCPSCGTENKTYVDIIGELFRALQ